MAFCHVRHRGAEIKRYDLPGLLLPSCGLGRLPRLYERSGTNRTGMDRAGILGAGIYRTNSFRPMRVLAQACASCSSR